MKYLLLTLLFLLVVVTSHAQLTGTKNIPGDYPTLAAAIAALNSQGAGQTGVTLNVLAGHTETITNFADLELMASGYSVSATITVQKSGTGNNPLITAPIITGPTSSLRGIFKFVGCDYVVVDGIDLQENPQNLPPYCSNYGYAFLKQSGTNGCSHVIVKNCNVTLNKSNTLSTGIYSGNHNATSTGNLTVTDVAGTNSFIKVFGNTIHNTYNGISFNGYNSPSPYTFYDQNNMIGDEVGNLISNFGGSSIISNGIYSASQNGLTITNNNINGGTGTTSYLYGINSASGNGVTVMVTGNVIALVNHSTIYSTFAINNAAGSGGGGNTISIINNTIMGCSSPNATTANFYGIFNSASPGSLAINGNNFMSNSTNATSGLHYLIYNNGQVQSDVQICDNILGGTSFLNNYSGSFYAINCFSSTPQTGVRINGNSFGAPDFNAGGSGAVYYLFTGSTCNNLRILNNIWAGLEVNNIGNHYLMLNNSIVHSLLEVNGNMVNGYSRPTADGSFYGYMATAATPATTTEVISGNTISNVSAQGTGQGSFFGIYAIDGASSPWPRKTIFGNTIQNIIYNGTATSYGYGISKLGDGMTTSGSCFSNNTVSDVTTAGSVYGLSYDADNTSLIAAEIRANVFSNLHSTGNNAVVQGCRLRAGAAGLICHKNQIRGLSSDGTGCSIQGIYARPSNTHYHLSNNIITELYAPLAAPASTMTPVLTAFFLDAGTMAYLANNTAFLDAIAAGALFSAACLFTGSDSTLNSINNNMVNLSTPGAGGLSTVFWFNNYAFPDNYRSMSDKNNLFIPYNPSPLSRGIAVAGGILYASLEDFQSAVNPGDQHSISELPPFVNISNPPYNLHIPPVITLCESGGTPVAAPNPDSTDLDGIPRFPHTGYPANPAYQPVAPDIGAYEFAGIRGNPVPANLTVTTLTVATGQEECFNATQTISVGGSGNSFLVQTSGEAILVAGQKINFFENVMVSLGGYLHAFITGSGLYCGSPSTIPQNMQLLADTASREVFSGSGIIVYPNPTDGRICIEFGKQDRGRSHLCEIYRLTGERILVLDILSGEDTMLNLSGNPPGLYMLRIITPQKREIRRLILR